LIFDRLPVQKNIGNLGVGTLIDTAYLTDAETRKIHTPALRKEHDTGSEREEEKKKHIKKSPTAIVRHGHIIKHSLLF